MGQQEKSIAGNTHLSNVAARIYLPFGENLTNDTGGLSSSGINRKLGQKG